MADLSKTTGYTLMKLNALVGSSAALSKATAYVLLDSNQLPPEEGAEAAASTSFVQLLVPNKATTRDC